MKSKLYYILIIVIRGIIVNNTVLKYKRYINSGCRSITEVEYNNKLYYINLSSYDTLFNYNKTLTCCFDCIIYDNLVNVENIKIID